jgi:non-specific serine/threonine protein kinase
MAKRYSFNDVVFDEARFELQIAGRPAVIQPKTLEILAVLIRKAGEVVPTEELIETVWPGRTISTVSDNLINVQLNKLRRVLGEHNALRIVTLPRIGYRFERPVEEETATTERPPALTPGMAVPRRDNMVLDTLLGRTLHSEVWRVRHTRIMGEHKVFKFSLDGQGLSALKRETTIFRVLNRTYGRRPDFVHLFNWNFHAAPFFLECEDGGQNLLQWAEEDKRLAAMPMEERLGIFLQIADAVAAAHNAGVLHKDLKPGNILIAQRPGGWQVKVADFGSGRLLDPGLLDRINVTPLGMTLTQGAAADGVGTPLYLAPELLKGQQPTALSDVYALGTLLYQIVIGDLRKPLAPGWERDIPDELLRADIAEATDGDAGHRLSSVVPLAERVRGLAQRREQQRKEREVEALARAAEEKVRVSEERERASREALVRTRLRQRALIAFFVPVVLGAVGMGWLYRNSVEARNEAQAQARRAGAVNEFYSKKLFGAANPIGGPGEDNPRIRDVLAAAGAQAEAYFGNDDLSKAAVLASLGATYHGMGDFAHARDAWSKALQYTATVSGPDSRDAVELKYRLAGSLCGLGKLDEATRLLDAGDAASTALRRKDWRLAVAAASMRGLCYQMSMNPAKVIESFTIALRLQEQHAPEVIDGLATGRITLADAYMRLNRYDEARAMLRPIVERGPGWEKLAPAIHATATSVLGQVETQAGNYDEAEALVRQAYAELYPIDGPGKLRSTKMLLDLADVLGGKGDFAGALQQYQKAYPVYEKAEGDKSLYTLMIMALIGQLQYFTGDSRAALQTLDTLLPKLQANLGPSHPATQMASVWLAAVLLDADRVDRAQGLLQPLKLDALKAISPDAPWQEDMDVIRGGILLHQGRRDEGVALLKRSLDAYAQKKQPDWYSGWASRYLQRP